MSPVQVIKSLGASVSLVDGVLKLTGLSALDEKSAAHALEVARVCKDEILAELTAGESPPTGQAVARTIRTAGGVEMVMTHSVTPADPRKLSSLDAALAELDRFFAVAVPDGAGGWIDPAYMQKVQLKGKGGRS